MDVRLKDGTIIRNVPEGTTQEELLALLGPEPEQPQAQQPDVGPVEAVAIGAGKTFTRIGQGMKQAYYGLTGNQEAADKLKAEVADEEAIYAPLAKARPFATGLGEALPSMAMPAGAGGAAATFGRAILAGALPGALEYGSAEDRAKRGLVGGAGGAAGAGLAIGASRAIRPFRGATGVSDDAMRAAERIGFKPTPAQASQNPALQGLENYLLRSPGSSSRIQALHEANQTALNRAAAKAMGENADTLGEATFASAKNRLSGEFGRLQAATSPDVANPQFFGAAVKVHVENLAKGSFARKDVSSLVDKSLDLIAQGNLSGKAYKEIHTELTNEATRAFRGGDATLGQAYKTIRDALDDAAKGSLGKADQEAWDTVRKQWAAFKTLTKGNVAEGGNVSAARTAAAVRQRGPQLRTGEASGELADIARVGEAFKAPQNPNSAAMVNQLLQSPLAGGAAGAAIGTAMGGPMGAVVGGALGAGATRGANYAASLAYTNPFIQRYLTQGLLPMNQTADALLQSAVRPAGLLGVSSYLGAQ